MSKTLVRGNDAPDNAEVLSDSTFISTALDQIGTIAQKMKDANQNEDILNGIADILELVSEVAMKHKMSPLIALQHVNTVREEKGSFSEKKAVTQE